MLPLVSYRVFARKYRPQTFEEVVGQEHITRTLQNAIRESRVAQAYMFVGPRGIGKTSTARILAKALNCAEGPTAQPCGTCSSCLEIAEGRSLDVMEIDGASNNGVENIRDLRDNAAYAPARGPFKIYLIDEVHMLSTGAFNALLKTLEEPPSHVKFIFATTEAQKVPATITSRCQRFDLQRIPADSIAAHLASIATQEKIALDPAAAEAIARAAEGGLRDAESMLDQAVAFCGDTITREGVMDIFGFTPRETVSGFVDLLLARDATAALELLSTQADAGKDLSRLLDDVTSHLRDLLVQGVSSDAPVRREQLLALLDHFSETEIRMRWAPDKKLQFDVAAIKAVHLLGQASLDEVLESLASLRRGEAPASLRKAAAPAAAPRASKTDTPPPQRGENPQGAKKPAPSPSPAPTNPPRREPSRAAQPPGPGTDATVSASMAWEKVATEFGASFLYRWLASGVFSGVQGNEITVLLPPSSATEIDSLVGKKAIREAEKKLLDALGKSVVLKLKTSDSIEEPEPEAEINPEPDVPEPSDPPPATETSAADQADPPGTTPPDDPVASLREDPLIQEALARFKAEIQD